MAVRQFDASTLGDDVKHLFLATLAAISLVSSAVRAACPTFELGPLSGTLKYDSGTNYWWWQNPAQTITISIAVPIELGIDVQWIKDDDWDGIADRILSGHGTILNGDGTQWKVDFPTSEEELTWFGTFNPGAIVPGWDASQCAEPFPPFRDTDGDGTPDLWDDDDDGDGLPDMSDHDDDGDGTPDMNDPDHPDNELGVDPPEDPPPPPPPPPPPDPNPTAPPTEPPTGREDGNEVDNDDDVPAINRVHDRVLNFQQQQHTNMLNLMEHTKYLKLFYDRLGQDGWSMEPDEVDGPEPIDTNAHGFTAEAGVIEADIALEEHEFEVEAPEQIVLNIPSITVNGEGGGSAQSGAMDLTIDLGWWLTNNPLATAIRVGFAAIVTLFVAGRVWQETRRQ